MIVKYCIVSRDADEVLRFFNVDTYDYDSMLEYDIAIKDIARAICIELNLSFSDVDIFEKYDIENFDVTE